jgi:uncharacterized Zn finger protein
MKLKLPVKQYKCNICGIVEVNSKELLKHQIAVHIDKMFQCQSCNKVFDTKIKFENHAAKVHGNSQYTTDSNSTMEKLVVEKEDADTESMLLGKAAQEKKARKRTRGPYRKSVSLSSLS